MGPNLRAEFFASGHFHVGLMTGKTTKIQQSSIGMVDVREVAFAHVQAMKIPEAANRRFILNNATVKWADLAKPLQETYIPLGWPLTTEIDTNPSADEAYTNVAYDNRASREVLGVQYRDYRESVTEMAAAMIALGTIKKPEQQTD